MKIGTVLLAIALLLYKVQAQYCGPPILPPPPLHPSVCPNPPIIPPPVVGTTIIDTSLSSALANVLQLLIVSDLIESTLNTALGHHSAPVTPVCEPVVPQPIVYTPTVDVTPVTEFYSPPCSPIIDYVPSRGPKVEILPRNGPVIDYLPPCAPIDYKPPYLPPFDFIPQYGPVDYSPPCPTMIDIKPPCPPAFEFLPQFGPVIDYLPAPVIDFAPPCTPIFDMVPQYGPVIDYAPTFDFGPPCATFIEPLPNFYGECIAPIPVNTPTNNYCGYTEYVTNITPMYGIPEVMGPVQMAPVVPNCFNGVTEVIGPRVTVGPVATEILYPSNVPAQMTCNIGNIPTSLPFVSVDPIPCGCGYGNNVIGNTYFY